MEKTVSLTTEELEFIRKGSADYTKIKINLGELELQKQGLIKQAHEIVDAFSNNERILIEKYGADSVINMQTGEVTQKQN
jgi:hypothetical protein|tara:strand:+ start:371 stop:610 length:240 start_codon:yes stop_codon:yes gene_type:complete